MIYDIGYHDAAFPDLFRAAMDRCTSFSLFYFGTAALDPIEEGLSKHREVFLRHEPNFWRKWPGMKGLHEFNFPAAGEALDFFVDIVSQNSGTGASCDLWQFALYRDEDVILWFQDWSEAFLDTAFIPIQLQGHPGVHSRAGDYQSLNTLISGREASPEETHDLEILTAVLADAFFQDPTSSTNPKP